MPGYPLDGHATNGFPTTQWGRVVTATSRDGSGAREGLATLFQDYWYPIYADIRHRVRRAALPSTSPRVIGALAPTAIIRGR